MNQKLTRRRFGQLAIASTATAAAVLAAIANKTFAQASNLVIVGVRLGPPSTDDADTNLNSTTVDSTENSTTTASTAQELVLQSLDVGTGQVLTLTTSQVLQGGTTPILQVGEELSGLTSLADGTIVLAINPASTSNKGDTPTRLTFLGTSPKVVTVSELNKQEKIESFVRTNDVNRLLGLVVKKNGTPPVKLVNINVQTGAISNNNDFTLPANVRFSNLAQCPDGKLYMTAVGKQGETSLVQLDQAEKKPITLAQLSFNGEVWNNGLQSLVCSLGGQLIAFGARRYETPNYLHTVDVGNGVMTRLTQFDVAQITIARA